MIAWLFAKVGMAMVPAPVKKVIVYVVVGAVALWVFKVFWLNPHDARVAEETKGQVTEQVKKAEEARWKPIEAELRKQNAELQTQLLTVQLAIVELQASRRGLETGLTADLKAVRALEVANRVKVDSIPVEELQKSVNALSAQLAGTGAPPKEDPKLIMEQLFELQSVRAQVVKLEEFVKGEREIYERERTQWQALFDGQKQITDLANKALELEKQKSSLYESLYNVAKKKKCGFGGTLKRIFTLGIARCG